jgi:hypothetical protein
MTGDLERNPNNHDLRVRLVGELRNYRVSGTGNILSLTTAAQAHAALQDTARSIALADSILMRDRNNQLALDVRQRMSRRQLP